MRLIRSAKNKKMRLKLRNLDQYKIPLLVDCQFIYQLNSRWGRPDCNRDMSADGGAECGDEFE